MAGTAGNNRVMVIDGGGSLRRALLGVQALVTNTMKSEKKGIGDIDVTVTFASFTIQSGDFIA